MSLQCFRGSQDSSHQIYCLVHSLPGVSLAGGAVAALLDRTKVLGVLLLGQRDLAGVRGNEGAAEARRPGRVDAVVHVDAEGWRQLYKNRSSWKIVSQKLFSRK